MNSRLVKKVMSLIPAGLLTSSVAILDSVYAARLSEIHLNCHSLIVFIPFVLSSIGKSMGHPLIICSSKEPSVEVSNRLHAGCLAIAVMLSSAFVLMFVVGSSWYVVFFDIQNLAYAKQYLVNQTIAAGLLFLSSILTYTFLVTGKSKAILLSAIALSLINYAGNHLAFISASSPEMKMVYFSYASIAAAFLTFCLQLFLARKQLIFSKHSMTEFWRVGNKMVIGQLQSTLIYIATPFILLKIFQQFYSANEVSLFSFSNQILHFILLPVLALMGAGASELGKNICDKNSFEYQLTLRTIVILSLAFSVVPSAVVLAFSPQIVGQGLGLSDLDPLLLIGFATLLARTIVPALLSKSITIIRVYEEQVWLAKNEGLTSFLSLGLVVVFALMGRPFHETCAVLLFPSLYLGMIVYRKSSRFEGQLL